MSYGSRLGCEGWSDRAESISEGPPIEATKGGGELCSNSELDTAVWATLSVELHEGFFFC